MKLRSCLLALPLVLAAAWVIAQEALPPAGLGAAALPPTDARHYSYAIGQQIGETFRNDEIELDADSLLAGLKDALSGAEPKFSEEMCMIAMERMSQARMEKEIKRNEALITLAPKFIAEHAKQPGVVVLPSGLQYKVITEGTGPKPKATDTVRVAYKGTFVDGRMFDESGAEPAEFQVDGVIPGWTEALQLMGVGSKWQLVLPSNLAYGPRGGQGMPPNATLVFDVELLGIQ
jgi:FKBP-type peptidyl-prolyl cis-trans isomerase FklB